MKRFYDYKCIACNYTGTDKDKSNNCPECGCVMERVKKRLFGYKLKGKKELHNYWSNPDDGNEPEGYLDNKVTTLRSEYLHKIVSEHFTSDIKILELGSNVGRNLNFLHKNGYRDLTGVEINLDAIKLMATYYPKCFEDSKIRYGAIENLIKRFATDEFDLVFTVAVLEHIHPESEWIFKEMQRISKSILVIEDEWSWSTRHCPRNYNRVFKDMNQIKKERCGKFNGLQKRFMMRLFVK